jgi:hypothetical protein
LDSSSGIAPWGVLALLVLIYLGGSVWSHLRAQRVVADWAASNGYEVISLKRRWVVKGPFTFPGRANWVVFAGVLATPNGQTRACWIRVGGYWIGLLSDRVTVSWEEDEPLAAPPT